MLYDMSYPLATGKLSFMVLIIYSIISTRNEGSPPKNLILNFLYFLDLMYSIQ